MARTTLLSGYQQIYCNKGLGTIVVRFCTCTVVKYRFGVRAGRGSRLAPMSFGNAFGLGAEFSNGFFYHFFQRSGRKLSLRGHWETPLGLGRECALRDSFIRSDTFVNRHAQSAEHDGNNPELLSQPLIRRKGRLDGVYKPSSARATEYIKDIAG